MMIGGEDEITALLPIEVEALLGIKHLLEVEIEAPRGPCDDNGREEGSAARETHAIRHQLRRDFHEAS